MKLATTLTLLLSPLLTLANPWHFETSSGHADGFGTHSCQKFFLKKHESYSFKIDSRNVFSSRITKRFASASPQSYDQWGSYNNPPPGTGSGTWTPLPAPYQNNNGNGASGNPNFILPPTQPPSSPQPPPRPNNNNNNPPQFQNGGEWKGPTAPPKCCLRTYCDDICKDLDVEVCIKDRFDGARRGEKGTAGKDQKSFNILCT